VRAGGIVRNSTARAGDALLLTKPIGTGVLISAYRSRGVSEATFREALGEMTRLNATACRLMLEHGVHACTDVTGFGILGHALEVAEASGVGVRIHAGSVPCYGESLALVRRGVGTAMTRCNLRLVEGKLSIQGPLPEEALTILADPQTSGGLLMAVPPDSADALLAALIASGESRASRIGEIVASHPPALEILA